MKIFLLLIFAGFIFQSYQDEQLQLEVFNRLFGDGEIRDPEHKQISETHICSSMDACVFPHQYVGHFLYFEFLYFCIYPLCFGF